MTRSKRRQASAPKPVSLPEQIDGPALIPAGEIYDLNSHNPRLGRLNKHYVNLNHPLDLALHREKISHDQFTAGDMYRDRFLLRERSGVDSTQGSNGGGGSGTPFTQTQWDAIRWLETVEGKLSERNRVIVRHFCGEGYSMSESLRLSGLTRYRDEVLPRILEALDELVKAVISRRKKSA